MGRGAGKNRSWPCVVALLFFLGSSAAQAPIEKRGGGPGGSEPLSLPTIEGVRSLLQAGSYAKAEAEAKELLAAAEREHGSDSLEAAAVLDVLVDALSRGGKAKEPGTVSLARRALSIRENRQGPENLDFAKSLNILAGVLYRMGDYSGAKAAYERSLGIREKALGPAHPDVATSLSNLAAVLAEMGDYEGARPLQERSLEIREKALGPDHPDVAYSLNNIGALLCKMGDYDSARPFFDRALAVKEKTLGRDHPEVARLMDNLAAVLSTMGDYPEARSLFERALSVQEKTLGPDHPDVAKTLNDLGVLLYRMGDYAAAGPLYERASAIWQKALGPDHIESVRGLNSLANLRYETGDYAGARPLFERALAMREKALGPEHPDVAASLNNLGELLARTGDYAGATSLLERALAILTKGSTPEHPLTALVLCNSGELLSKTGDFKAAKSFYERALAMREKTLGPDHPDVAESLRGLAASLFALGERGPGMEAALRSEAIAGEHVRLTARALPERQALLYAAQRTRGLDVALSIFAGARNPERLKPDGIPGWSRTVFDAVIRSRALVFDEVLARHRVIADAADPEVTRVAAWLSSARRRLANLTVRGPGDMPADRYLRLVDGARREKEDAERALAEKSARYRREETVARAGFDEIASALPPGGALVAFSRYNRYEFPSAPQKQREPVASYIAFVLRHGEREPAVVPLGEAAEIDASISRWRKEAALGAKNPFVSSGKAEASCRREGEILRREVWDPLIPFLRDVKEVFVVPDGAIVLVNFSDLPAGETEYLVEKSPLIHYLSAERDLVAFREKGEPGKGLLAIGGPSFDETSLFRALAPKKRDEKASLIRNLLSALRGETAGCAEFESLRFREIPASKKEVEEIAALWRRQAARKSAAVPGEAAADGEVAQLTGADACERAFKATAPGKRVLHIATHAFFLAGRCESVSENPLLLTGLVLAGANNREAAAPDEEDGMLTAEEIAGLDLSGVEWAVLSACDTGGGEIRAGEGILGLRRAFRVGGAGSLIMSLWPVEDEPTRQWMNALYDARLRKGLGTAASVREADLSVLRQRRAKGQSTHPFFWGGFVAEGNWE
jgi:tetratricopeptide (TPR) repeat protein/CHAT domain-containing protein